MSRKEPILSSVSVIQSAEPRSRADNRPAERGGDVFSEILENTASLRGDRGEAPMDGTRNSPLAPVVASANSRAEVVERSKPAKNAEADKHAKNAGTSKSDGDPADACASGKRPGAAAGEKGLADSATGGLEQANGAETAPTDAESVGIQEPDIETAEAAGKTDGSGMEEAPEEAEQPGTPEAEAVDAAAADGGTESESDAGSVDTAAASEDDPAQDDVTDDGAPSPAGPADGVPEQDATVLAAAAVPSVPTTKAASAPADVDGEKASAVPGVNAGNSPQTLRGSEQAPGQQPVHPNPAGDAARENAPSFSDGENPQQQPHSPPQQHAAQDVKPASSLQPRAAEATPSAALQIESSPTAQPDPSASALALQPARQSAASANPASFQSAAAEANPVPLTPNAIAVEIVGRMRGGQRHFDIRLDPPELGRIEVRLDVDRHGNVSTRLTVDRPETLDLMQRDARSLERALQQAGLKTDDAGLQFSLRQHAENHGQDGHGGSGRPSDHAVSDEAEIPGTMIESYRASILARGGVDIRV